MFFFFNQTYLIYLFLFIYYDICRSHRYYFHTALDQIPYEVYAFWCIVARNHIEIKFREVNMKERLWLKGIALHQVLCV